MPACGNLPEVQPARPAPTVAAMLLLPHDRLARAPLREWGRALTEQLSWVGGAPLEPRARSREVAVVANQVALVAVHQGRADAARALCEAHIGWQLRLARRAADPAIATQALQPWINLGRLEALAGDWAGALDRFAGLVAYRDAPAVLVAGVCVSGEGWDVAANTVGFAEFLEGVYVIDSLKALLQNRRNAELLAFAAALPEGIAPPLARFGAEASVAAWCRARECRRACDAAVAAARSSDGWERAVFLLRLAEALLLSGDAATAREVLSGSVAALLGAPAAERGWLKSLYVVHRYAGACREAGLDDEALSLARLLLRGARAARDEVFEVDALRLLTVLAPAPEQARWAGELEALEKSSLYMRCRRGDDVVPMDPGLDALYKQLEDVLTN